MKVIYMGTPDFAVPTLDAIIKAGHEVLAVVTQPDKPKGRGKELSMPPVKELALQHGITVYQPVKARDEAFVQILKDLNPEVIVVVAFGQILPKSILDIPKYGCVNVHGSLLPEYRGAAPIQWAVIDGRKESGVTTMQMDVGIDTGDMLMQTICPLDAKETGGSLFDKLSIEGAKLLVKTLEGLEAGTVSRTPQDSERATHAGMLNKSLGNIDFTQNAAAIECLIRGLNPWPSAYTYLGGKMLKIWDADVVEGTFDGYEPGQVVSVSKEDFVVRCGENALSIKELQLEGKKRMTTDAFLLGTRINVGERLCQNQ
ncbi:MAG: methionyl-tRNA formyltransferase [Lachnospiraceae bacterium]